MNHAVAYCESEKETKTVYKRTESNNNKFYLSIFFSTMTPKEEIYNKRRQTTQYNG